IKIKNINFQGNNSLTDGKLRSAMSNTRRKFLGRFWKGSKYVDEKFKEDLESILDKYSRLGYRDSRILADSISWNEDNTINIDIKLEEGRQYIFGDIIYVGNKSYTDQQLNTLLKIEKGDIYNGAILKERITGDGSPTSDDIQTLYQNSGYLFSSVNAVETRVVNDSITVEIRIREDEKATIKKVSVVGNDKTNDFVIFRELRVKPGSLFSRDAIKIELQGGYGGGSFIGTLGLTFNNFSLRNVLNKEAYKPLPMGDGQSLSLRLQTSRTFNTYSFSFTEPWLGGKKPQSLSFSVYSSKQFQLNPQTYDVDKTRSVVIIGASLGLAK
ncbi:MAG: POTRA domain-containing protein, partial [Vicingaceae bacterium]